MENFGFFIIVQLILYLSVCLKAVSFVPMFLFILL